MTLADDIRNKKPMVVPGVYDALGAKMAQSVGFDAMFQTGYGTSATLFGMPDYGFVGAAETLDNARRICSAVSTPVIVDADTGYGGALNVRRLVQQLELAGAAGMFLEDQIWPKRCGHMHGKDVTTHAEYTEKLGAALDARQNKDFVIVARTDARATLGLEDAIQRGVDNYKTGADVIFIEAPLSISEMEQISSSIKAPLVANMIEGGATPLHPAKSLHDIGFSLVLYPLSVLYASAAASLRVLHELHQNGTVSSKPSDIISFDQFNELVGLSDMRMLEERYKTIIQKR